MSARVESNCRLCSTRVPLQELHRGLCPICDEYAQHLALQTNERLDKIVGAVQAGAAFRNASRTQH